MLHLSVFAQVKLQNLDPMEDCAERVNQAEL